MSFTIRLNGMQLFVLCINFSFLFRFILFFKGKVQTIGEQNHFKCSSVDRFMSHRLQNAHSATRTAKKGKGEEKKRERKGSISKKISLNIFLFDYFSLLAFLTYLLSEYIYLCMLLLCQLAFQRKSFFASLWRQR